MFTKLKNDEFKIKGRVFPDGINKRNWISKEYISSPTVSTEVLMLSCMIDTMEVRDVANADILGAFLQTDYNKGYIHIKMDGTTVTLIEYIDPTYYKDFIYIYIHGKKFMHT